jgi:peroxiredoxin
VAGLPVGTAAPDAPVISLSGEASLLAQARGAAPTVLFFFKVDCPTCPIALSAVDRMHQEYGDIAARVIGLSQDGADETREFLSGVTFPALIDAPDLAASKAFAIDTVPTLVLISAGGRVERIEEGWSRQAYNEVSRALAQASRHPYVPASDEGDGKPPWKPG